MRVHEIPKIQAIDFIQVHHYSKVMPRITKHYLGIFDAAELLGVLTLGYGTQPLQTIKKLFLGEGLTSNKYFEIGKMCFTPSYNKDKTTGSQVISIVKKWIKNNTDRRLLYTLADGIVGKVGYVYQASNFYYGGYFWTDVYIGPDGEKIHPRSTKKLLEENAAFIGKEKLFWMTPDFCKHKGIQRIRGKMFRYIIPLDKKSKRMIEKHKWNKRYPKDGDLAWKIQIDKGKYKECGMPRFALDVVNVNYKNVYSHKKNQL